MTVGLYSLDLDTISKYLQDFEADASRAASMALNQVAGGTGRNLLKREMQAQVNFPAGYLNQERLGQTKKAYPDDLSTIIAGRDDPTSLARFVTGQIKSGLRVRVAADSGGADFQGAWLQELKNGNMGFAFRLSKGATALSGSRGAKPLTRRQGTRRADDDRVFLLYGPSVDQVFRNVAVERADDVAKLIEIEFLRQFTRISGK